MIAMLIESQITQLVNWGFAAAAAVVLLAVTLGGFSLVGQVSGMTLLVASEAVGQAVPAAAWDERAGGRRREGQAWLPRLMRLAPILALGWWLDALVSVWRRRRWARGQGREVRGDGRGRAALDLYAGAVFFFLILPTFVVVPISLSAGDFLAFPPPGWSLKWYVSYFSQPPWLHATLLSFQVAVVTMLASTVLGTLGRVRCPSRTAAPTRPGGQPHDLADHRPPDRHRRRHLRAARAVEPYRALSRAGHRPRHRLHRLRHGHRERDPRRLRPLAGARRHEPGAGPLLTFRRVTFPLIRAGVLSGAVFAFIHSFDEVIITMFISGVHVQTLPLKMWEDIRNQIDPTIAAVSSMLILLPVAWLIVLEVAQGLNRVTARADATDRG